MNYKEIAEANKTLTLEESLKLPKKVQAARLRRAVDDIDARGKYRESNLSIYVLRQVARLLEHGGSLERLQKGLIL